MLPNTEYGSDSVLSLLASGADWIVTLEDRSTEGRNRRLLKTGVLKRSKTWHSEPDDLLIMAITGPALFSTFLTMTSSKKYISHCDPLYTHSHTHKYLKQKYAKQYLRHALHSDILTIFITIN